MKYTKECVASIRKHTPEPHEIIFVDNGSKDGTVKWLKSLVAENPHYRLIANRENLGFSRGCNQGIEEASGEYILLLNNDVVVTPNWLAGMMECLLSSPCAGIVGPMTNHISGPQKVQGVRYHSVGTQLEKYAEDFREVYRHRRIPMRRIVGFCMLFRRSLVEQIGLLDESFGSGNFEDDDFCLRATSEGYRNFIAGDVFIHHYGSRTFIGNRIDYGSAMAKNREIHSRKWTGLDPGSPLGRRFLSLTAMEKGDRLKHEERMEEAIDCYLEAIRHSKEEQRYYLSVAESLIDAKRFKDALDVLNEMPGDLPDSRKEVLLGYSYEGLELYEKAEEIADSVLSSHGESAMVLNLKGMLAYRRGDKEAAETHFKKAIVLDPSHGEPYTNLGVLKWVNHQKDESLKLLERGFILSPTVMDIATTYHSAISDLGEFPRAEGRFREAIALHPSNRRLKHLCTDVLLQQGKYHEAMVMIQGLIADHGVEDGMLKAALAVRERIESSVKAQAPRKPVLSLCMIVKNEEDHLARCLRSVQPVVDEMIIVDTGSSDRTRDIARAFGATVHDFQWTGDFAEARNQSLALASGRWILILDADEVISREDHDNLRNILTREKRAKAFHLTTRNYVNSVTYLGWQAHDGRYPHEEKGAGWIPSTKVRLFVNDPRIRFTHKVHELVEPSLEKLGIRAGQCSIPVHHYGKLDKEKATRKDEEYFNLGLKKLEESGEDLNSLIELAKAATGMEKYPQAVELWQRVIDRSPGNAVAYLDLSHAAIQCGDYEQALKASESAMKLDRNLKEAVYNFSLSVLYTGKEPIRAMEALKRSLERTPDYPPALGMLATFHILSGETETGLRYMEYLKRLGFSASDCFFQNAMRLRNCGRSTDAIRLLEAAVETGNADQDLLMFLGQSYGRGGTAGETMAPADW